MLLFLCQVGITCFTRNLVAPCERANWEANPARGLNFGKSIRTDSRYDSAGQMLLYSFLATSCRRVARADVLREENPRAGAHKSEIEETARQVARWLVENSAEFEQQGISDDRVTVVLGLGDIEAREAVDELENREDVVRVPKAFTMPPRFQLQPGRGWPEFKNQLIAKRGVEEQV